MASVTRPGGPGVATGMLSLERAAHRGGGRHDRHGRHRLHRHAGTAGRQADRRLLLPRRGRRPRRSRAATTCSRSTWRWIRSPATRWPTGRRATATSGSSPDLSTLRRIPWLDRTALVLCDVVEHDGAPGRRLAASGADRPVRARPRDGVHADVRLRARVLPLQAELRRRRTSRTTADLTPTIPYILDYHILATTMDENVIGQIRRGMQGAGIPVEFSKGEAWYGQHELNMRYADAVTSADRHTIYKNGVKEIAFLNGVSATFMAKPSEKDIGSSCHIHSSLVDVNDGASAFVDGARGDRRLPPLPRRHAQRGSGSSRCSSRRRSTPTSATRPRAGRRPRSRGAATTARAASGSSATGSRAAPSAGSPAPTSTRTSATRRCSPPGSTASRTRPTRGPS